VRTVVLLLVLFTACGPGIDTLRLDPAPRPERPASEIRVLVDEPHRPFTSIALVEAQGGNFPTLERLTRRLQEEAALLGGDAIIVGGRAGKTGLLARVIVFTP